jgi:hypothetical protein
VEESLQITAAREEVVVVVSIIHGQTRGGTHRLRVADRPGRVKSPDRTGRRSILAWAAFLFGLGGAGLVVWTGYLAISLPTHSVSAHYNIAWTGFDTLLAVLVLATAWFAYRRSPRVASTSAATAALLLADAWFDITTAAPGRPLLAAILLAAFIELPAAALALQVHRKASKKRSK